MSTQPQKTSNAWAISLILHVGFLLAIAFLWTNYVPSGLKTAEQEKPVGIVIASIASNQVETEYFGESTYTTSQASTDTPSEQTTRPTLNQPLTLPDIDLPGLDQISANSALPSTGDALDTGQLAGGLPSPGPSANQVAREQGKLPQAVSKGPVGEVSLFGGSPAIGHDFVFVIDRSKSMGGQGLNALVAAQQQITHALEAFKDNHHFNIIAYHHRPTYFQDGNELASANLAGIKKVNDFFNGLAAFGGTDHEMGIIAALRYKPDVIFFMTDGGDPSLNQSQLSDLKKYSGGRTSIHSVQFGFGPLQEKQNFMSRLAEITGGNFHYVDMRKSSPKQ